MELARDKEREEQVLAQKRAWELMESGRSTKASESRTSFLSRNAMLITQHDGDRDRDRDHEHTSPDLLGLPILSARQTVPPIHAGMPHLILPELDISKFIQYTVHSYTNTFYFLFRIIALSCIHFES